MGIYHGFNYFSHVIHVLQISIYQNIAKHLTHPSIIEKAMYMYYQNIAKLLTHPSITEKAMYMYYQNIAKLFTHLCI